MLDALSLFNKCCIEGPTIGAVNERGQIKNYKEIFQFAKAYSREFKLRSARKVAILLPSSARAYAAMFASWMAKGQYCPINADLPESKIDKILQCYQPDIVLTNTIDKSCLDKWECLSSDVSLDVADDYFFVDVDTADVAYTIFTSGSTGEPKGVQISHRALAVYLQWVRATFPLRQGLKWSQHPNLGFDLSVLDIFGALCHGATLYPLDTEFSRLFPAHFIEKNELEVWNSTPSVIELMWKSGGLVQEKLKTLKLLNVCGEALKKTTLDKLFTACPFVEVQNTYGPTEATVSCTSIKLNAKNYHQYCKGSACFGEFNEGMGFVLDCVQDEKCGELLLYGDQLSKGYLDRDELTAENFVEWQVDGNTKRCYRTGDIVEVHEGNVYFFARKNELTKIKGKLVDVLGVEACISSFLKAEVSVVCVNESLILFTVSNALSLHDLRKSLINVLEPHELPQRLIVLDKFPQSTNNKVDRLQLKNMAKNNER